MNASEKEGPHQTQIEKMSEVEARLKAELGADFNHIEPGIKESVIALVASGVQTTNSCEGHVNHGRIVPWISVGAYSQPQERYIGQEAFEQEIFKEHSCLEAYQHWLLYLKDFGQARDAMIAKAQLSQAKPSFTEEEAEEMDKINRQLMEKHGIADADIERVMDVLREMEAEIERGVKEEVLVEETEEYQQWKREDQEILSRAQQLVKEFYGQQPPTEERDRLIFSHSPFGHFLRNDGQGDYVNIDDIPQDQKERYEAILQGNIPIRERNALKKRIEGYQAEFKRFTEFLKSRL